MSALFVYPAQPGVYLDEIKLHPSLLIIAAALVIVSYAIAGVPFLNTRDDIVARSLHFSELMLICIFILQAVLRQPRTKP